MIRRQSAEIVAFNLERAVEARTEILERNGRSEFHHLLIGEMLAEFSEDRIGDLGRSARHALGIAKDRFLVAIEMRARIERGERLELIVSDAGVSAHGRVDVHSERASDHLRRAYERKCFERAFDCRRCRNGGIEPRRGEEDFGAMRHHETGGEDATEDFDAFLESVLEAFGGVIGIDSFDAHGFSHTPVRDASGLKKSLVGAVYGARLPTKYRCRGVFCRCEAPVEGRSGGLTLSISGFPQDQSRRQSQRLTLC
jgi:hypothetical protein